jgi:hypothetical protein
LHRLGHLNNFEFYRQQNALRRRYLNTEESRELFQREDEWNDFIGVVLSAIWCLVIIAICLFGIFFVHTYTQKYIPPTYSSGSST